MHGALLLERPVMRPHGLIQVVPLVGITMPAIKLRFSVVLVLIADPDTPVLLATHALPPLGPAQTARPTTRHAPHARAGRRWLEECAP